MKNQFQGIASMYLLHNTELDEEEHDLTFNPETIVSGKLQLTDCKGILHTFDVMEVLEFAKTFFQTKKPLNASSATK
jgi:hypothetical protein